MTQQEFESCIGTTVATSTFEFANRVYMAAGDMDKDAFCHDWKESYVEDSKIVSYLTMEVESLQATKKDYEHALNMSDKALRMYIDSTADFLIEQAEKWSASDLRQKAIDTIGLNEYLRRKIQMGFNLWKEDRDAVIAILNKQED